MMKSTVLLFVKCLMIPLMSVPAKPLNWKIAKNTPLKEDVVSAKPSGQHGRPIALLEEVRESHSAQRPR